MRNRTSMAVTLVSVLILALLAACGSSTASVKNDAKTGTTDSKSVVGDAARGRQLFSQSCVACHGADAKGLPGLGKDMTTSPFIKGQSDAQLVDFLKKGRPVSDPANTTKVDMPPKGGNPALTDAQLADIVAFVRSLVR